MALSTKAYFIVLSFLFPLLIQHPHCVTLHSTCSGTFVSIHVGTSATTHTLRSEDNPIYQFLPSASVFRKSVYSVACICVYQDEWPCLPFHSKSHGNTYIYYHAWLYLNSGGSNANPCLWRQLFVHWVSQLPSHTLIFGTQYKEGIKGMLSLTLSSHWRSRQGFGTQGPMGVSYFVNLSLSNICPRPLGMLSHVSMSSKESSHSDVSSPTCGILILSGSYSFLDAL